MSETLPSARLKLRKITPTWYSGAFRFPLAIGTLRQPFNASLPKERNRQSRAVVWEDTNADEEIPDDGELDKEPLIDEEELEPSDKIEESGGRTGYFEQPTERSGERSQHQLKKTRSSKITGLSPATC